MTRMRLLLLILVNLGLCTADLYSQDRKTVTKEDMPRIPFTSVKNAVDTFELANGFSLEIVAAEPLVSDPVDACFDEHGRMYVAEMHGYPFSHEPTRLNPNGGGLKDAGIIRLLTDTNGDGKMDKSQVFADGISWPTSVCCYNGGVFVVAPQFLYYLKDTDNDGRADIQQVVLSGFGRDNVQSVANGLVWGLDNKIYFAAGRNPKDIQHRGNDFSDLGSVDLRFDPKTEQFESVTGGLQYGHSLDEWGTRYVCSNSNHIQQVIYPLEYVSRNPFFAPTGMIRSIAADGASSPVFRISPPEPWRIVRQKWRALDKGYRLVINKDGGWEFIPLDPSKPKGAVPTEYPVGYFTSATGITIYLGDAYPKRFHGNAFIGDVGGNLVHRKTIDREGIQHVAKRADEGTEILRSRDNWFRPVNFVNAPDGSLYVLDMYRETIEHPYSIPEEIKAFLDLTSGRDRGRVYRLVSPDMKRRAVPDLGAMTGQQLVKQLGSQNVWNRRTAQRLIWERGDKSIADEIRSFLSVCENPTGRLHCLFTLDGLGSITVADLKKGLSDPHPRVIANTLKLCKQFAATDDEGPILKLVLGVDSVNPHVQFQLAFALGEFADDEVASAIAQLMQKNADNQIVINAALTSVGNNAHLVADKVLSKQEYRRSSAGRAVLEQLALVLGSSKEETHIAYLLSSCMDPSIEFAVQQSVLAGLGEGLNRRGSSLQKLVAAAVTSDSIRNAFRKSFERAINKATDTDAAEADRLAAVQLLRFNSSDGIVDSLASLLSARESQQIQLAAVDSLLGQSDPSSSEPLVKNWSTFSPVVRRNIIVGLVSNKSRISTLFDALESDVIKSSDIDRDIKQQLLQSQDTNTKQLAQKWLDAEIDSDRAKVVENYQDVLELESDDARGFEVFKKRCAVCHRVGETGNAIAPDLNSVQNKSEADLLISILDPNREAQPNFNVYSVITEQGQVISGIIKSETAASLTLQQAGGKSQVILRSNVDILRSTGLSLMPEGLEKDLSKQDLADVIRFVKSIKPFEK